jgi:hypothetical protein
MSKCAAGLCAEDDRNAPARDDSAWCAPTEVPVGATILLDGGATRGALTTTLLPGVDPAGVGGGPECVRLEQGCHVSGRPDASEDPTNVRLGGRPPADGKAVGRRGPTALRLPKEMAVRRPPGLSSKAVQQRRTAAPSAGGRPQSPSAGSRPPPPSIWGRPPTPSALYDSNFSFLHYVFASLITLT